MEAEYFIRFNESHDNAVDAAKSLKAIFESDPTLNGKVRISYKVKESPKKYIPIRQKFASFFAETID